MFGARFLFIILYETNIIIIKRSLRQQYCYPLKRNNNNVRYFEVRR